MDATLMLLATGETRGCGSRLVDTGEGVLSPLVSWKPVWVGLRMLTALYEAAEVSVDRGQVSMFQEGWAGQEKRCRLPRYGGGLNARLLDASVLE